MLLSEENRAELFEAIDPVAQSLECDPANVEFPYLDGIVTVDTKVRAMDWRAAFEVEYGRLDICQGKNVQIGRFILSGNSAVNGIEAAGNVFRLPDDKTFDGIVIAKSVLHTVAGLRVNGVWGYQSMRPKISRSLLKAAKTYSEHRRTDERNIAPDGVINITPGIN